MLIYRSLLTGKYKTQMRLSSDFFFFSFIRFLLFTCPLYSNSPPAPWVFYSRILRGRLAHHGQPLPSRASSPLVAFCLGKLLKLQRLWITSDVYLHEDMTQAPSVAFLPCLTGKTFSLPAIGMLPVILILLLASRLPLSPFSPPEHSLVLSVPLLWETQSVVDGA